MGNFNLKEKEIPPENFAQAERKNS